MKGKETNARRASKRPGTCSVRDKILSAKRIVRDVARKRINRVGLYLNRVVSFPSIVARSFGRGLLADRKKRYKGTSERRNGFARNPAFILERINRPLFYPRKDRVLEIILSPAKRRPILARYIARYKRLKGNERKRNACIRVQVALDSRPPFSFSFSSL